MNLIDGKLISSQIKNEVKNKVEFLNKKGIHVGLAVIQVGEDEPSSIYVRNKVKACEYTGIESTMIKMKEDTTENELIDLIIELNNDDNIDGILVQLPLPKHIDTKKIIDIISPDKDVDGFTKVNCGSLFVGDNDFVSCTPIGVLELLKRYNIDIAGKNCCIIGRSNEVGKPMAMLMLQENATVTICHSKTNDLKKFTKEADILISAIGKAKMIDRTYLKENVVVIDIGINKDENNKLCGDVNFDDVKDIVSYITPVPGGVGPMTIAMLMNNCVKNKYLKYKKEVAYNV